MASILVVDDEPRLREALRLLLKREGHAVEVADSGEAAERLFANARFDAVVLDIWLPGMNGVQTFERLRRHDPDVVTVFLTAHGSIKSAVAAIRAGGFDYLTKPFDNDELLLTIRRAVDHRRLCQRVQDLELEVEGRTAFPGIIGRSEPIRRALVLLAKVARTDTVVLLSGESGTGKELAARGVHVHSRRAERPFVAVNCASIAGSLAEAELFGHERGAFTDARARRAGHFETADGGTLFLDEVGDLPADVQAKLLRVLEEGKVQRLGSSALLPVDVRIVAATNRDLEADVSAGRFRHDLYWRLSQFPIRMPPLRERREDLPLLVGHLLRTFNAQLGKRVEGLAPDVLAWMQQHDWPGNVRELATLIRWGVLVADAPIITNRDLRDLPSYAPATPPSSPGDLEVRSLKEALRRSTEHAERTAIEAAMSAHKGRRTQVAAALGLSRRALFNKLKQYGLDARWPVRETEQS
jgi:DNA-binding NtrC family response regulator